MIIYFTQVHQKRNKIYATGGRVLNFVSISDNFNDAKINIKKSR